MNSTKPKPSQILGGIIGGFDEIGLEMEAPSTSSVAKQVGGFIEDVFSLVGAVTGIENNSSAKKSETGKFSSGSLEFNKAAKIQQDQAEIASAKRVFFQALKEDQQRAKEAKEKLFFEEEINDLITNLPTDQKNELLHYQASYRDNSSVYQRAELRRKIIEQKIAADKQQKEVSMAETKTNASAMQTAFEGGSGTQGGGQSNLSFQATG